ncbi:MAG: helix-turn-helix domain-containing protein [Treponema sp.]|nr:helix-turn-helix domain-containing protein [Treponema sp.]
MYITDSGEILLSIQEAAKEIGVAPATIRNWEKQGLFSAKRAKNGYRFFTHDDMTQMRNLIRLSKEKKISVTAAHRLFNTDEKQKLPPPVELITPQLWQSEKWKKCRLERGFDLARVAKAVQISPSYLHKLENENVNVSIEILQRLADFYGENLLYYIADPQSERHIVRKGALENVDIGLDGVSVEPLVAMNNFRLSAMMYTVAANSGRTLIQSHHGEEFLYILSGKIHFYLKSTEYILSAGDSVSFRSTDAHTWFNHSKRDAQLLWVYTPDNDDTQTQAQSS